MSDSSGAVKVHRISPIHWKKKPNIVKVQLY